MLFFKIMDRILARLLRLSLLGFKKGPHHITRYYMYEHLSGFKVTPETDAKVLSISHSDQLCETMGLGGCETLKTSYPDYDILNLKLEDNSFDYVVSDQVLEHIEGDPQKAIDETLRVLKPGGLLIHATCFINPVHEMPCDLWRFTPSALKYLCSNSSQIIECGGWGNRWVPTILRLGLRMEKIPELKLHPMNKLARHNDYDWPVVTWIVAKK